jgi:hypothetical protein
MTTRVIVFALSALLVPIRSARADETLAEAAAREKERRAEQKAKKGKTFTDEDLKKLGGKPTATPDASAAGNRSVSTSEAPEGRSSDESTPEFWRPRVDAARAEVARREAVVKDLEVRIKELRDSVSHPVRLNEANRDGAMAREALELQGQLETARQSVDEGKQALDDLLEEARHAGVPADQLE